MINTASSSCLLKTSSLAGLQKRKKSNFPKEYITHFNQRKAEVQNTMHELRSACSGKILFHFNEIIF